MLATIWKTPYWAVQGLLVKRHGGGFITVRVGDKYYYGKGA